MLRKRKAVLVNEINQLKARLEEKDAVIVKLKQQVSDLMATAKAKKKDNGN